MKPGLSLRVSQHLALTPQLQQSIRLLQLSTLELAQEVEQMLDDNPFLEQETEAASLASEDAHDDENFIAESVDVVSARGLKDAQEQGGAQEHVSNASPEAEEAPDHLESDWSQDWAGDGSVDEDTWSGGDAPARGAADHEVLTAVERAGAQESLTAFLHQQALSLRLSELDRRALWFLIENLNDDGYLEESLDALALGLAGAEDAELLEELQHHLTVALRLLQSLEPVGVGAQNLAQCLRLQLLHLQAQTPLQGPSSPARYNEDATLLAAALQLCAQPLELLARRDVRKLMQMCALPEATVRAAMALIARLEPKPGRRFAEVERHVIVPDVLVQPIPGTGGVQQFSVQLNPDVLPRLRVHEVYANALRGHKGSEGHAGLQQRLQEARWFLKNVQQRFDTILRVSRAIVERQKNFFVHGALAMRPLVLRDIADELGMHESTISRVTTAKYMATPQGTYELKFFFGSGLGTETGGSASSTAVRALIKQFIAAENASKPLSDSRLADMLKEQGIECARRTVAKYREGLKIPTASLRKAL